MPLTSAQLIDDARNKHPAFNDRDHPDKGLLREIARLERVLLTRAAGRNPDYKAAVQVIALPAVAAALNAHISVHSAQLVGPNNVTEWVDIIPWHAQNGSRPLRCVTVRDGTIYLVGDASLYTDWTSLEVTITPAPTAIPLSRTGLAQALTIGDEAEQAIVSGLVVHMAGRGTTDKSLPPIPFAQFTRDHQVAINDFELAVGSLRAGEVFRTVEKW